MHKRENKKLASDVRGPSFSVQDEIRRDRRMRRSGRIRRARSAAQRALTTALCLLLGVLLLGAILLTAMRTDTVTVSGNTRYSSEEILCSADVSGEVLLLLREKNVYNRIAAACPYVERIELVKTYPSGVEIKVYETAPVYFTEVHGKLLTLDSGLRVMDYTEEVSGLVGLALPELKSAVEGSKVVFLHPNDETFVLDMLEAFVNCTDPIAFTWIDLRDRYDLAAAIEDKVKVLFGDYKNPEVKMQMVRSIIADAEQASSARTLINVSEPSRAGVQYDYRGEF